MSSWIGIEVSRTELVLVHLEFDAKIQMATVKDDKTLKLQDGPRGQAYRKAQEWLSTYLREHRPSGVVVKGSALPPNKGRGGASLGLLEGAEFRGAVMACVAEAERNLQISKKASLSRTFGERNVDDYVKDDAFWEAQFRGKLRKGSREAALIAFASARDNDAV